MSLKEYSSEEEDRDMTSIRVRDDGTGPALTASPRPEGRKRPGGRRRVLLVVIVALGVLLVGVTLETVFLGSGAGAPAVNSPSNPLTGKQLFSAYAANQTQAVAAYTN